jgi:uncharacterized membrane protein YbhN (UPF0104 family)
VTEPEAAAAATTHSRRRRLLSLTGPLALAGVLVYVIAHHGHEISRAWSQTSFGTLLVVTVLTLIGLAGRSEAVVLGMTAMGERPDRTDIHPASGAAYLASSLNHYLGSPVRAAVLKRLDPERAPSIPQMILVDGAVYLIEGLLAAVVLLISAETLKLPWWIPILALIGALAAVVIAAAMRRRFERHPVFHGLALLSHSRLRLIVLALVVLIFTTQIARTLLVLRATGLHPSVIQAAATFVAGGVLSTLLAGPAAGSAAAPLIIFGRRSLGAAAAAGLILSVTMLIGSLLYALACSPVALWRLRRRPAGTAISAPASPPR